MDVVKSLSNADIITKVLHYANNVGWDDWKRDLAEVVGHPVVDQYASDKMDEMRGNFIHFFCELDDEAKRNFTSVALLHYGIIG